MMKKLLLVILVSSWSCFSYAVCQNNITPTAPNSRYQLLNNNTEVKDLQTNLTWQRCRIGQTGTSCTGNATLYTWPEALQAAQNIGDGWRIPNIKELISLVEHACYNPSINTAMFPNAVSNNPSYWSSSPMLQNTNSSPTGGNAWFVGFNIGSTQNNPIGFTYYSVRLVRSN